MIISVPCELVGLRFKDSTQPKAPSNYNSLMLLTLFTIDFRIDINVCLSAQETGKMRQIVKGLDRSIRRNAVMKGS